LVQLLLFGLTARLQQIDSLSPSKLLEDKTIGKWFKKHTQTNLILAENWLALLQQWDPFLIFIQPIQIL
jgi:hypothetical protein